MPLPGTHLLVYIFMNVDGLTYEAVGVTVTAGVSVGVGVGNIVCVSGLADVGGVKLAVYLAAAVILMSSINAWGIKRISSVLNAPMYIGDVFKYGVPVFDILASRTPFT